MHVSFDGWEHPTSPVLLLFVGPVTLDNGMMALYRGLQESVVPFAMSHTYVYEVLAAWKVWVHLVVGEKVLCLQT